MNAIEILGLNEEEFKGLYIEHNGFDEQFNTNHEYTNRKFFDFLKSGCEKLMEENEELVILK